MNHERRNIFTPVTEMLQVDAVEQALHDHNFQKARKIFDKDQASQNPNARLKEKTRDYVRRSLWNLTRVAIMRNEKKVLEGASLFADLLTTEDITRLKLKDKKIEESALAAITEKTFS